MAYPYADRLKGHRLQVDFCLEMGEGPVLREVRDRIDRLELRAVEQAKLSEIDAGAIEYALTLEGIDPQ
ncbi:MULTISPECIES: hypothetical protein [Methylomicrobium]|uniref:hypothetical protein n=1 Tax=Methylomicrobium TaxID=39773 RepID=UPI00020D8047|nr:MULTISPECIES: hypothetical protein [Methylomicrobium]